jgi:hypothetical protein
MSTTMFRIGQVAQLVGTSMYHIRRLCECGLVIGAEQTTGGWYIPAREAERLKQNLPPIPAPPPQTHRQLPKPPTFGPPNGDGYDDGLERNQLEDRRGKEVVANVDTALTEAEAAAFEIPDYQDARESPEVRAELDSVQIAAARLQKRRIDLKAEEVEDGFRAREAARAAEVQRARAEQGRQRAEAARVEWRNHWLNYAQHRMPYGASPSVHLQVNDTVAAVLDNKLSVNDAEGIVSRLVDAQIAIVLDPYNRDRLKQQIVDAAINGLPGDFYWLLRRGDTTMDDVKQVVREAIEALGPNATEAKMKSAVSSTLQPLVAAFQHNEAKRKLLADMGTWRSLTRDRPSDDERSAATEAVRQALDKCEPNGFGGGPGESKGPGAGDVRQKNRAAVETQRRRRDVENETDRALQYIQTHLIREYEFDSPLEVLNDVKRLREELRPIVVGKFFAGKFRDANDAQGFIAKYIDEHIDLDDE